MKITDNAYKVLEHRRSRKRMNFSIEEDYNNLIDLALEMKDFEWAKELTRKRKTYRELQKRGYRE